MFEINASKYCIKVYCSKTNHNFFTINRFETHTDEDWGEVIPSVKGNNYDLLLSKQHLLCVYNDPFLLSDFQIFLIGDLNYDQLIHYELKYKSHYWS